MGCEVQLWPTVAFLVFIDFCWGVTCLPCFGDATLYPHCTCYSPSTLAPVAVPMNFPFFSETEIPLTNPPPLTQEIHLSPMVCVWKGLPMVAAYRTIQLDTCIGPGNFNWSLASLKDLMCPQSNWKVWTLSLLLFWDCSIWSFYHRLSYPVLLQGPIQDQRLLRTSQHLNFEWNFTLLFLF